LNAGNEKNHERVIDENLKRVFQQTLEEGIPDRFKNLLEQLKAQESESGLRK
jgi:hypothetical protein